MSLEVVFPNIEQVCIEFLDSAFTARSEDVWVSNKIPNPRVDKMVRVSRIGGGRINLGMDSPQVLFECWGTSEYESAELARTVRALVGSMSEFASESGSVVSLPDGSGLPRYQFAAQFYTAGEPL